MKFWTTALVVVFALSGCAHVQRQESKQAMCEYPGLESIPASSAQCVAPAPPPPPPAPAMCPYPGLGGLTATDPQCVDAPVMAAPPPIAAPSGMPQFPWPVPKPSAVATLPARLCINKRDSTIRGSWNVIQAAFHRSGYPDEERTFTIGLDEGFVILGRMEAIKNDGTPKIGPNRWGHPLSEAEANFSVGDWFREVFSRVTGRYRVIAIVVTKKPLRTMPKVATLAEIDAVANTGALGAPPDSMGARRIEKGVQCFALIYEWERPSVAGRKQTHMVDPSLYPAKDHLLRAHMWSRAQLEIQ